MKKQSCQTIISFGTMLMLLVCCNVQSVTAQEKDTIQVQLNNTVFLQGDTVNFEVNLNNYSRVAKTATIQLWIEEIKTGRRWKYRYPLVNGYINAKLKISDSLQDGKYAFNFLLQKSFFNLTGVVRNAAKADKQINYVMIAKDKESLFDAVSLDDKKSFTLHNLLFQDSAFIIFSRVKQKKSNDLLIDIKTPLDSAFVPAATETKLITIGKLDSVSQKNISVDNNYIFRADGTKFKTILPEVVVKTKSHKQAEEFEKENVTGLFTGADAIELDGLGSDEIANAPDFYTYLTMKVPGLRTEIDNETGNRSFTWRNQPTDIFINEIKLDPEIPIWINPSDIALIKIFRPGTSVTSGSGAGGAIAIYTKTGAYSKSTERNYSFYITGYTPMESTWQ